MVDRATQSADELESVAWWTLWGVVTPRLEDRAADEARFDGVSTLGVDEHVRHHTPHKTATKGPPMFTGMADLTRDQHGRVHARLLDPRPGQDRQGLRDLADSLPTGCGGACASVAARRPCLR